MTTATIDTIEAPCVDEKHDPPARRHCCANCSHARIVPGTRGWKWRCDVLPHKPPQRLVTFRGRFMGELTKQRSCRHFDSMGD